MPFSFTLPVGLLEKGERADQRAGVMEVSAGSARGSFLHTVPTPRGGQLSEGTRHPTPTGQTAHQGHASSSQAKAIWRFLGADPMLARAVLHILLYDNPEKGQANAKQTQDRSCPQPAWLPPATTSGLWELVRALGQVDTLEGLEDDLFASYFLTITCSPARHLSGAQQDLPSDASPHRAMAIHPKQALKSILRLLLPNLQASQEGEGMACTALFAEFLGSPLLMENEPKAMQKQVVRAMLQWTEDSNIHIQGRVLHGLKNAVTYENSGLRQTSMELFGHLSKFVSKKSSLFRAEVEKSMGTLLIHLQDRNPQVTQDTWWTTEAREEKAWNACPANPAWHTPGSRVADPP
ncbi:unnamed protein product [Eretmochelys imbricata]